MNNQPLSSELEQLGRDLIGDIKDLRNGNLPIHKAKAIADLSCQSIRSISVILVSLNNQELQNKKLAMRENELSFKKAQLADKKK